MIQFFRCNSNFLLYKYECFLIHYGSNNNNKDCHTLSIGHKLSDYIEDVHDELIERYFLDINSYLNDGYQI